MLLSLTSAATSLRRRELSARELVEWQLRQIELFDPNLHTFVSLRPEASLREADRLDARGVVHGPLHGIPIAIKDNIAVEGFGTSAGSPLLDTVAARRDAAAVRRLRAAGAIVIGKNALYELAFGAQSECWPPTQNPWRLGRATAGSSSGSAASVAAGLSFAALGSDTGGSIRVPAAFCGVVGIRPTAGTIPRDGLVRLSRLDEIGPLTRTAEDAALVFDVLRGRPTRAADRAPIAELRLGVCAHGHDSPEIAVAVDGFCETLRSLGARLSAPFELDLGAAASALWTIAGADAAQRWLERVRPKRNLIHPLVMERIVAGAEITDEALTRAREQARRIAAELERVFGEVDVLALPVAGCSGYPLGARSLDVAGKAEDVSTLVTRYTPLASVSGLPALVLPCGTYDDGMPVGAQLVAAAGNDDLLLEVACQYQQATGWHERVPNEVRVPEHLADQRRPGPRATGPSKL